MATAVIKVMDMKTTGTYSGTRRGECGFENCGASIRDENTPAAACRAARMLGAHYVTWTSDERDGDGNPAEVVRRDQQGRKMRPRVGE